jgi:hypothetical protein
MTRIALGHAKAEDWAARLRAPKSRAEKLGLHAGVPVHLVGTFDAHLDAELDAAGTVRVDDAKAADVLFVAIDDVQTVGRLEALRKDLKDTASVWCVWPKGQTGSGAVKEDTIRSAARSMKLVDVKVVRFSDTHGGLKLIVPVAHRQQQRDAPAPAKSRGAAKRAKASAGPKMSLATLALDLRTALEADAAAKSSFAALTPAQQRGVVASLDEMKGKEARTRLIERIVVGLREGSLR